MSEWIDGECMNTPDPQREQTATIDRNFGAKPVLYLDMTYTVAEGRAMFERWRFYRWLAFSGRISG